MHEIAEDAHNRLRQKVGINAYSRWLAAQPFTEQMSDRQLYEMAAREIDRLNEFDTYCQARHNNGRPLKDQTRRIWDKLRRGG